MRLNLFLSALVLRAAAQTNVLLSNDDGWATSMIRAQYEALSQAGFSVLLSSPAENQSGTGSNSRTPTTLQNPCQFDTCPSGSPAVGSDASNPFLNYVNAYPVDAVRYGIQNRSAELFGAPPDLVISGPNIGANLGLSVFFSGTIGAAAEAAKQGIPSIAFSSSSGSSVSYTTLQSSPNSPASIAARTAAALTTQFVDAIIAAPGDILPAGISVNVNYASVDDCAVEDYRWVLSRIFFNLFATDVEHCGGRRLPTESDVVGKGCFASVSVFNAENKLDAGAEAQAYVLERLGDFLSCLP